MEVFTRLVSSESEVVQGRVPLTWERRQKSRQRVRLDSGEEVALLLPRGTTLSDGQRLASEAGRIVEVIAEAEPVSTVRSIDPTSLTRAAYHLGNRHTPVQLGEGWLRYREDHVLDAMIVGLGIGVVPEPEQVPFEPESGAYSHGHSHG